MAVTLNPVQTAATKVIAGAKPPRAPKGLGRKMPGGKPFGGPR